MGKSFLLDSLLTVFVLTKGFSLDSLVRVFVFGKTLLPDWLFRVFVLKVSRCRGWARGKKMAGFRASGVEHKAS